MERQRGEENRGKLLVLLRHKINLEISRDVLDGCPEYETRFLGAVGHDQVIEAFREYAPDLVIMSWRGFGLPVLRVFREMIGGEKYKNPWRRVVIWTGGDPVEIKAESQGFADEIIYAPDFPLETLKARVILPFMRQGAAAELCEECQ
jgi:hypothetical protein